MLAAITFSECMIASAWQIQNDDLMLYSDCLAGQFSYLPCQLRLTDGVFGVPACVRWFRAV